MTVRVDGRFGPNTEMIEEMIERATHLTYKEAVCLNAAAGEAYWHEAEVDSEAFKAMWQIALESAALGAWSDAWGARLGTGVNEAWDDETQLVLAGARKAAFCALVAIVAKDLISPQQFDVLYGPWKSVIERSEA